MRNHIINSGATAVINGEYLFLTYIHTHIYVNIYMYAYTDFNRYDYEKYLRFDL